MHKCLTCFREFRLDQVHYRCVKPGCTAKDEKLSRHMKGTVQIMGTAITPENLPGGKAGKAKGGSQIPCPECQSLTTIRLCPHCHGELPSYLDDVPGHTVFIVGPRGSGKSVYLVATIEHLAKRIFPTSLKSAFELSTKYTETKISKLRNKIYRSGDVLPPTELAEIEPEILLPFIFHAQITSYRPYFYPLTRNKPVNIGAFDIAGEACVDQDLLQENCPNLPKSDALIIIIDPTFFPRISNQLPVKAKTSIVSDAQDPALVITQVTKFCRMGKQDKIQIPTAFVVTKVDALKYCGSFDPDHLIFQEAQHRRGYDHTYCDEVSNYLETFLSDPKIGADKIIMDVEKSFAKYRFFAVTSLGDPPTEREGQRRVENINPKNPENPWLWILHELGFLSEA